MLNASVDNDHELAVTVNLNSKQTIAHTIHIFLITSSTLLLLLQPLPLLLPLNVYL